jgi:hypothetical protein
LIVRLAVERLAAFRFLEIALSPGLNVVTGMNATGKTQLLRILHAGCLDPKGKGFGQTLVRLFGWEGQRFDRLLFRSTEVRESAVEFDFLGGVLSVRIKKPAPSPDSAHASFTGRPDSTGGSLLFPGSLPEEPVSGRMAERTDPSLGPAFALLEKAMPGRVVRRNGRYRIRNTKGELEILLASSGVRQLAILSIMIRLGTLIPGTVFLWDTPEADIGPTFMGEAVGILLELAKAGVQIVVATRDYVFLKECDLRRQDGVPLVYHCLFRDDREDRIRVSSSEALTFLSPNPASEAFRSLFDRDVDRALKRTGPP